MKAKKSPGKIRKEANHPPGCSDIDMQKLWRKVVRSDWNNQCAFNGSDCEGNLECHHIVKRARPHLKHSPANGALLCIKHHDLVGSRRIWRAKLDEMLGDKLEYLDAMEKMLFPEFLSMNGHTRATWLQWQKKYLSDLLEGRGIEPKA